MRYDKHGFLTGATPPCDKCDGRCCRQKPHDQEYAVLLNRNEIKKYNYAVLHNPFSLSGDEWVIPYKNGKCPHLGKDNRCTIYEDRPKGCKQFKCTNCYNREGNYAFFLRDNPKVVKLIKLHVLGANHD
jgi:Fe-S-cluster containining protein